LSAAIHDRDLLFQPAAVLHVGSDAGCREGVTSNFSRADSDNPGFVM
jgi:hypothetical protein